VLSKNVDSILRDGNTSTKKQKRNTVVLILPDLTITESTLNAKGNIENEKINTDNKTTYTRSTKQNKTKPKHTTACYKI